MQWKKILFKYGWAIGVIILILLLVLFLPIPGKLIILTNEKLVDTGWPRFELIPKFPDPGEKVELNIYDNYPWIDILITVNGKTFYPAALPSPKNKVFVWKWIFTLSDTGTDEVIFYHDCKTGAKERGRFYIGNTVPEKKTEPVPTKLGVFLSHPERDWHNRSGWNYLLTYTRKPEDEFWGIDYLASQVYQSQKNGLKCIVWIDFDREQALPPVDDNILLAEYLDYIKRLANDDRLKDVCVYFIGSIYNEAGVNMKFPDKPVTPEWYARVFNGYERNPGYMDNVVQVIKNNNPLVKVMVGPTRPWCNDMNGDVKYKIDIPYLNYMNTLVYAINQSALRKQKAGIPNACPDGFAVSATGRPEALSKEQAPLEPLLDLRLSQWKGAQSGFRVYKDWMDIINSYPATKGLPLYLITNTYCYDVKKTPSENYVEGWLKNAFTEVNNEPQIHALCWFMDYFPHDDKWKKYSLFSREGRMLDAAVDFDNLLIQK